MAMEEAVEQKVQGVVLQVTEGGVKLTVRCGAKLGKALIKGGWKVTVGNILKALGNALSNAVNTGHVSEKKLQSLGQDVHEINLADDTKKEVTKSLRKAGITYSVEPADNGQYFLHFQGKDRDHTMHAVNRAFERMGLEFNTDNLVVQDETRTEEQTRNTESEHPPVQSESNGQEEQAHASAERSSMDERSVDWNSVDVATLTAAANEFWSQHGNEMSDMTNVWSPEELSARYPNVDADTATVLAKIEGDSEWRNQFDADLKARIADAGHEAPSWTNPVPLPTRPVEHAVPTPKPTQTVPTPNEPASATPSAPGRTGADQGTQRPPVPLPTSAASKPSKRRRGAPQLKPETIEAFRASFKKPPRPTATQPKPPLPKPSHRQSR